MKNVQQVREFLPSAVLIFACFIFLSIAVYSYNQLDLAKNDIEGTSYTYINEDGYQYEEEVNDNSEEITFFNL